MIEKKKGGAVPTNMAKSSEHQHERTGHDDEPIPLGRVLVG